MRFEITRASDFLSDNRPCDEAIKVEYVPYEGSETCVRWELELTTLEQLVAFSEKHGNLTFDPGQIWIYDDYME